MKAIVGLLVLASMVSINAKTIKSTAKVRIGNVSYLKKLVNLSSRAKSGDIDDNEGITANIECEIRRDNARCTIIKYFQGFRDGFYDDLNYSSLNEIILNTDNKDIIVDEVKIGETYGVKQDGTPKFILLDKSIIRYSKENYDLFIAPK